MTDNVQSNLMVVVTMTSTENKKHYICIYPTAWKLLLSMHKQALLQVMEF